MALILRETKGSPLTFQEMDGNLTYLESISGGGGSYYDNGNSSVNTSIDWSRGSLQELGIDNDPTLSFTGATAGQKLTLLLRQVIGGSKKTITWANEIFWRNGVEFALSVASSISLDSGFGIGVGFDGDAVQSIVLQPDGKILVGGGFDEFNGTSANGLVRLNADGSLDSSFNIGDGFQTPFFGGAGVISIALQPDGKILAGGRFNSFDGNTVNGLARLNADGSLDSSFDIGNGFQQDDGGFFGFAQIESIALQSDGKILAGGFFNLFDEIPVSNLVRLNTDGSLDSGFELSTGSTGFDGEVKAVAVQPDGKILAGGQFNSFNGTSVNGMARLNADGTLDSGFDMSNGFDGEVASITLQSDGKILAGGGFKSFDGSTVNNLARLNADGTLDSGFDLGSGFDDEITSIAVQSDGKILAGGRFTSFNGSTVNGLARLNADGTLDSGFDLGSGFDDEVISIAVQPDGKILAGGWFNLFNGNTVNRLARLVELTGDAYSPVDLYWTGTRFIGTY